MTIRELYELAVKMGVQDLELVVFDSYGEIFTLQDITVVTDSSTGEKEVRLDL